MTNPKNQPNNSDQNYQENSNDNNEQSRMQEVELPTPQKKNDDITAVNKTENADWQRDKINEANNQQGGKENVDDKADIVNDETTQEKKQRTLEEKETREDSILNRPRTETYEIDTNEDTGKTIKDMNYTHEREEKRRKQDNARKHEDEKNKNRKESKFTTPT